MKDPASSGLVSLGGGGRGISLCNVYALFRPTTALVPPFFVPGFLVILPTILALGLLTFLPLIPLMSDFRLRPGPDLPPIFAFTGRKPISSPFEQQKSPKTRCELWGLAGGADALWRRILYSENILEQHLLVCQYVFFQDFTPSRNSLILRYL